MERFEKKKEHFEKNMEHFEKNPGQNAGRALCEKPYRSSPPFCAPEQVPKTFEKFMYHLACLSYSQIVVFSESQLLYLR